MRIAICDDDSICRKDIVTMLAPYVERNNIRIYEFVSGQAFVDSLNSENVFDIVFMDIEMEGINGIDSIRIMRRMNLHTIVFFVTSYSIYISKALRVGTFQYMLKPIERTSFDIDMQRALKKYRKNNAALTVKTNSSQRQIKYADIIYIETYGRGLLIHTLNDNYTTKGNIKGMYDLLKDFDFIKSHQSYIVNMRYITTIDKTYITMSNGDEVILSRHEKQNLMKQFNFYLNGDRK